MNERVFVVHRGGQVASVNNRLLLCGLSLLLSDDPHVSIIWGGTQHSV